jgi:hypothetical protein
MPQLWLTFEEIADLLHCDSTGARHRVIAEQWERRRYNDGVTRVQLPPEVAHDYMLAYAARHEAPVAADPKFDAAMAALRSIFSQAEQDRCEGNFGGYSQAC